MSAEQRAAVDHMLREASLDLTGELGQLRQSLLDLVDSIPLPSGVTTTSVTVGGIDAVAVETGDNEKNELDEVVLYLHGGAFVMGSAHAGVGLAAELSSRAGTRAVSLEYRLAPEHVFPAAPEDVLDAYRGLLKDGIPAGRIALAGESAGAGLVLTTLIAIREAGLPQPACAVLMCPWVDLTLSGASVTGRAELDPALTADGLRLRAADYAAGADLADERISPLFADLKGIAPMLIQSGSHDILLDDALRLATRAAQAGVQITLDVTPGVPHVFQALAMMLDEGVEALDRAGTFIRRNLF